MRRLSGASNGGSGGNAAGGGSGAAAGQWEGSGNAARIRGVNAGIMDEKVLELVFRTLNWDPQSLCVVARTSGRSFLSRRCAGDLLYVSDPCEHAVAGAADDVGAYRGVFRGFMRSRTRAWLVGHRAPLEPRVRCPYCGARVWSMTAAGLAPRSASRRLGANDGRLEYFVCVSGHLHGSCWLARLSDSEGAGPDGSDADDASADEDDVGL
ncbi:hypothetical protein C2845_PM06G17680 [Panicum miliaceum]|uniref:EID1-like F-box protein 3 n=1 Tax=Panicum miliaceum TaxID=4540 RepID=A0A3L6RD46_PANMI|nr:hypothetical protein C2845_PM06G17680 [Panicum miliaceum]